MPLSLCPSATGVTPPRRARKIASAELTTLAAAFVAAIPAVVLGYLLVEDIRIATMFALLVAITLLGVLSAPDGRRGH